MTDLATAINRSTDFRLHPLGFFYLQNSLAPGTSQRVHVWLPVGPDRAENDSHQHSFDIKSKIMIGSMRNELFRFQTPGGTEREFSVSYKDGRSILSPTGRSGTLALFSAFDSNAGSSYFLEAGVIHRVMVTKRPCVTMLRTEERGIQIFSYGGQRDETPFVRRIVNASEAYQIEQLLRDIAATQL
jgi:hypothetical protein